MKAVRLHTYREPPTVDQVAEPEITGPNDVIVRVGGAGLCRTDLHIRDGWFAGAVPVDLPLTLGHETAGWVHAVGSAVEHVAIGTPSSASPTSAAARARAARRARPCAASRG
jgi:NAD+-dependent secondary alcohol dehydrogenase Adh1